MEDCLIISFDSNPPEIDTLVVARKSGKKLVVINQFWNDEAVETYNKLVGNVEECCKTCKYCEQLNCYCCMHPNHAGDYVPPYTVCGDYKRK